MSSQIQSTLPQQRAMQDVAAPLTFIVPQDSKPYFESAALTGAEPKVFFETEQREVRIRTMRAIADSLSLDREGFELHRCPTAVADLYDDAQMYGPYEAELIQLLIDKTGADRAAVFDYTRRSDGPDGAANSDGLRGPAVRVHVDYTVKSGPVRASDALGVAEVDRILRDGGRIVQINVWRPITGPVLRSPLALGAANSIAPAQLVATDQKFPDRVGEIYNIAHASDQRWYWAPEMERDEVLLIKGWDSLDDGRAQFTPHGAFSLPNQDMRAPPRESIEARAYVVFEGRTA